MVWFLLIAAAYTAGIINSIAGGGSFLTFPSLVYAGLPAVSANASSTVALVPATFGTAASYRGDIRRLHEPRITSWFIICSIGGVIGAALLLVTSDRTFRFIAPWLLLLATLLFAFGSQISKALHGRLRGSHRLMLCLLFPIAIYGGYFGGGIGIMILAAFELYGLEDIHAMNGVKALLSATLNTIASVIFMFSHQVRWPETVVVMVAGIMGGLSGPVLARRLPRWFIRGTVIATGIVMTTYFFHIAPR